MKRYPAIQNAIYNTPHLITPGKLNEIEAFVRRRVAGEATEFEGAAEPRPQLVSLYGGDGQVLAVDPLAAEQLPAAQAPAQEFVAVLPLFGTIFQHGGIEMDYSGGTSTEQWQRQLRRLDANPAVKTVVIEGHTPGGQVIGTQETADLVRQLREAGRTRIIAVANSLLASAGVWIGTAAKEVYVTPGGEIGSIGVVCLHFDYSKAYEDAGIKPTLVATSPKKIAGNEYVPLDAEALAELEHDNQVIYDRFLKAMAANRGVTTKQVETDFGGGGMLFAKDAVKAGLADGVATMQEVLEREVGRLNKSAKGGGRKSVRNQLAIEQVR